MILKNITKRLKLFLIPFSLILLLPTGTSMHACGFLYDTEELRYMIFNPDLLHRKAWWSFFYSDRINYLDGQTTSPDDENLLTVEWIKQLKLPADTTAAFNCLFGSLSDSALRENSFFKTIDENPDAKRYFEIAKTCERLVSNAPAWEDDETQHSLQHAKTVRVMLAIEHILEHEQTDFYKIKYAFQLVKLAFYTNETNTLNLTYNKYFKNGSRNVLYWWATHYKSMMLEQLEETDSANYLHAQVFSHASNKMLVSKQFFSSKNLAVIAALSQNDAERADVFTLAEVVNPGRSLEGIRTIYRYNSGHRHLPLLIGREINKLEDWLGSTKYANAHIVTEDQWSENPTMQNWERDYEYLSDFIRLLNEMPVFAHAYPDFYNLSMTYLHLMKGETAAAAVFLDQVKSKSPEASYQRSLLEIILIVQRNDITDTRIQQQIGELYASLLEKRADRFESQKALYSLSSYLRYTFANKGMVHLAGLFDNYALNKFCATCDYHSFEYSMISYFDQYASAEDVARLIQVYEKPVKNKLEQVLLLPYTNANYLNDLLSVKYLRQGMVKEARQALQKIPDSFWFSFTNAVDNLNHDPFLGNSELLGVQTMVSYTKREIVEKMYDLEQALTVAADRNAQQYFMLGNAWYNFTANSWFMISYELTMGTIPNQVHADKARAVALGYHKKALQLERNDENKTKLLYMIALLSDKQQKVAYAKRYEKFHETTFYRNKNCLTLKELAGKF